MKNVFIIALLFLTGCSSTNISELVSQLKQDPAIVHARIASVYGTVDFTRVGETGTNRNVTVSPDGTVQVRTGP